MRQAIRFLTLAFFFGLLTQFAGAQSATIETIYGLNSTTDGQSPFTSLVEAPDGNYYGTTLSGGSGGYGTIFRVSPKGVYTVLYSFQNGNDGGIPEGTLYLASDGYLYGTASRGGANGGGTIYRISQTGVFTVLYSFSNGTDGGFPASGVIEGSDGNFYGTTVNGGAINDLGFPGYGVIYQVTPGGVETPIYTFTGGDIDGSTPYAGLVEGSDGFLYGTTNSDEVGDTGYYFGSVFKVSKTGVFTNLYHFNNGDDGGEPDGGLVEAADGSFFGSTHNGGINSDDDDDVLSSKSHAKSGSHANLSKSQGIRPNDDDDNGQGVLYNITPSGTIKTLYEFTGGTDSANPEGTLVFGSDGNLYGTTSNPPGAVFQLTPSGGFVVLSPLSPAGVSPVGSTGGLIVGSDGNLWGTTDSGGANGSGTIFAAIPSPTLTPVVQLALSASTVQIGTPVTLNWQNSYAFSTTAQRCVATVQNGATGAGTWTGLQKGTLSGNVYSGSAQVTPTAAGAYTYALTCGGTISGFATLTVPAMITTTSSVPNATVGTAYSQTLGVQNGLAPYTWTVITGTLPAGLSLDPSSGTISGTPTTPGVSNFTVQVTDTESTPEVASVNLSITVAASVPTIALGSTTLNISAPGATASTTFSLSGFAGTSYSFSCSGLPIKSQCIFSTVAGTQSYGTATLQVVTDGGLSSRLDPQAVYPGSKASELVVMAAIPGMLALFGFARRRRKATLSWLAMVLFTVMMAGGLLTGCGGGSKSSTTTVSGDTTPAGTSTVTVTATSGDQSATTTFSLQVQ